MDAEQVAQLMTGVSAVLTVLVGVVFFGWRRDKREAREAVSKARQQAEEAERRAQDLALSVDRAEREAAAELREQTVFDEERQARPSGASMGGPALEDGDASYAFQVKNRGKVVADNVTLWLVDAFGAQLCEPRHLAQMLEPDETAEITLRIRPDATPPLRVYSRWRDTSGLHQRESWVEVPEPPMRERHSGDAALE